MPRLPSTFVSASIAHNVKYGPATSRAFMRSTSAAEGDRLHDDCGVCLLPLSEEEPLRNTKCTHIYHRECISQLLSYGNKCPLCRAEWYSPKWDTESAKIIRKILRNLEINGHINLGLIIDAQGAEDDWAASQTIYDMVCMVVHCTQIQDINGRYRSDPAAIGELRNDPELRAQALEQEESMREISTSAEGRAAVKCVLRCITRVSFSEIQQIVVEEGVDSARIALLIESVLEATDAAWRSCHGRGMSSKMQCYVRKIVTWTLVIVAKGVVEAQIEREEMLAQEAPVDLLCETEEDRQSIGLLDGWCPALC